MTESQALTEARKRWGRSAWIEKRTTGHLAGKRMIGYVESVLGFRSVVGMGDSWAEAFTDADRLRC